MLLVVLLDFLFRGFLKFLAACSKQSFYRIIYLCFISLHGADVICFAIGSVPAVDDPGTFSIQTFLHGCCLTRWKPRTRLTFGSPQQSESLSG